MKKKINYKILKINSSINNLIKNRIRFIKEVKRNGNYLDSKEKNKLLLFFLIYDLKIMRLKKYPMKIQAGKKIKTLRKKIKMIEDLLFS